MTQRILQIELKVVPLDNHPDTEGFTLVRGVIPISIEDQTDPRYRTELLRLAAEGINDLIQHADTFDGTVIKATQPTNPSESETT